MSDGLDAPDKVIERPGFSPDVGIAEVETRAVLATRPCDGEWGGSFVTPAEYMDELALWWLRHRDRAGELALGRSDGGPTRPPASEVAAEHGGDD